MPNATIPSSDVDLFSAEVIADPWDVYRELRDLGPVVHLRELDMLVVSRYADVRSALTDDVDFISGQGVHFNDVVNEASRGTMLGSDGEAHRYLRGIVGRPLSPRALQDMEPYVAEVSRNLVDAALEGDSFDAVELLANAMPMKVVPDLLGWEEEVRSKLFGWAEAGFDASGPMNERCQAGLAKAFEMLEYVKVVAAERRVAPGSLSEKVFEAADRGEIREDQCPAMMLDYLAPSLDTTASALGAAFMLFARFPDQWQLLREDPDLLPNAINEVIRWQTPIRAFSRFTSAEVEVDGTPIPAGSRVMILFASANRDERFWDEPAVFDVTRENASRHVGFGYGTHGCLGQGLTRLEAKALFGELLGRVERFEPAGEPRLGVNNLIRAYKSVPVKAVLASE
jgi:cytochrome P450